MRQYKTQYLHCAVRRGGDGSTFCCRMLLLGLFLSLMLSSRCALVQAQGLPPSQIMFAGGDQVESEVSQLLTLIAIITNANGQSVPGVIVTLIITNKPVPPTYDDTCRVTPKSASLSLLNDIDTITLPTDINGQVQAPLRVGTNAGDITIQATVASLQAALAVTALPNRSTARHVPVGGRITRSQGTQEVREPVRSKLIDGFCNPLPNEEVEARVAAGSAEVTATGPTTGTLRRYQSRGLTPQQSTPDIASTRTSAEGIAEFEVTSLTPGSVDIRIDVSAPDFPELPPVSFLVIVGALDTPDIPQDIDVVGNIVYIANRSDLRVIDVSKPAAPQTLEFLEFEGTVSRLALDGNWLYVPTSSPPQLHVLDITEPSSPMRRGVVDLSEDVGTHGIKGVVAENGYVFMATDGRTNASGTLQVVNVQNRDNPQVVGSAPLPFRPRGIAVLGNRVYVTSGDGLYIFNISNPTQPIYESERMGNFSDITLSDITLNGNVEAYVVEFRDNQYYFTVLDLSDPSAPLRRGSLKVLNVRAIDTNFPIAVSGRFAYLVEFAFGLLAIDVNDPDTPLWMARIDTPSEVLTVVTGADGFIYATDYIFGLQVIRGPLFDLDTDGDGTFDDFSNSDGDGIIDFFDVFPNDPKENRDTDRDGIGDNEDLDDDNDGFLDEAEQNAKPPSDEKDPRIFPLTLPPSGTTTIVVDDDSKNIAPAERNGTPATPYHSITEGLRVIKALRQEIVSPDEMLMLEVRAGTYSPTTTQEVFPLGFAGTGPLTLRGEGKEATVIDAAFTADALSVSNATGVVIEDVACIRGASGVFGNRAESITLRRNRIAENVFDGISLGINSPEGILITDNFIEGNADDGISLFENAEAEIRSNMIRANADDGISVTAGSTAEISLNTIADNTDDGVVVHNKSRATITDNVMIRGNDDGIFVTGESVVEISLNTIADNMDNAVQVQDSTATITGNEIRNNGQTGILVTTDACAVINGGMIANSGKAGVHLQRDSFAAIGFGAEAAGNLTLTQNVGDGITIADDSSFALINRARVIFDANGGGEIVGLDFTANPADPRVDQIRCFMP